MRKEPYAGMDDFAATSRDNIKRVQQEFDVYQKQHFDKRSPEFFCLELNGEAGELANIEKKRWKGKDIPDDKFADEAADVCIALMNYANARGIDLGGAVSEKLLKIEAKRLKLAEKDESY
jgi:NTP pyrophosphatase (non-canonical NTP hydrolase)